MTLSAGCICRVCGATSLEQLVEISDVPALCNRLCQTESEAFAAPLGDIVLSYCRDCGHICNVAFDPARLDYDGSYENSLAFSPRYRRYAQATADRLIGRYRLEDKHIIEIGCGTGDFLRLLCEPGNTGQGYDPSQEKRADTAGRGRVQIAGRDFRVGDARGADLVCCRHVLEHLAEPAHLLRGLREDLDVGAVAFFEVPNALFILDRLSVWDLLYEHVSYFTASSLARGFTEAGFTVLSVRPAFDDQYLCLEARVDTGVQPSLLPERPPDALYRSFRAQFIERVARWRGRIDQLRRDRRRVVVWGAGAKGSMFLNLLRVRSGEFVDAVIDINPRKQGHFVPATGHRIMGPDYLTRDPPDLVIVMNPVYQSEVCSTLSGIGISCEVVVA